MKGGLAAAMIAAAAIKRSGVPLGGRPVVGALVDEEGDMLGVKHLCAPPIGQELDAAIICEPEQNQLCLEQRGVVWARVLIRGRMAHGAMPEAGVNPIAGLAALLHQAPRLERRLRRLCRRSRYLRPPTVTATVVQAPVHGTPQSNVIPSAAQATLDIRLTPGPDETVVSAEIERACRAAAASVPGLSVEWWALNGFPLPAPLGPGAALAGAMIPAAGPATRRPPGFGGVAAAAARTNLPPTP